MDKTEEILNWYIKCIETGTVCCRTERYYIDNYLLQYNDAILKYRKMIFDSHFPEAKEIK